MANKFSWGAAILGELGKVTEAVFDAQRTAAAQSPAAKRKATAQAAAREEACTPCAVNGKISEAREKARAFSRKTG